MGEEDKHIDEHLIASALDLEVFEEHVDAEILEGLVNNVVSVDRLEGLTSRTIKFGLKGNERHAACHSALEVVVARVLGLSMLHALPSYYYEQLYLTP